MYKKVVTYLHYELILNYLFILNQKIITEENLKVTEMIEYPSRSNGICRFANLMYNEVSKTYTAGGGSVCGIIKYLDEEYIFTASISNDNFSSELENVVPTFAVASKKESYKNTGKVFKFILNQSIARSNMKNGAFGINGSDALSIMGIEELNFNEISNDETYLPERKIKQFTRFKQAILKSHRPLRFLLSGKPGTGKTQIVNSILKEVHGKILILKLYNFETSFNEVFKFIKIFDRSLLVIDDIDLFLKDRDMNFANDKLFEFLQFVDTNVNKKIFLLATTNDKKLVDMAASRPGRFDMIIDMDNIEIQDYLDLIKRETNLPEIINCFDNDILQMMQNKSVTGSFIVNLIKQLHDDYMINNIMNRDIVLNYFNLLYRGFYDLNSKEVGNYVGF